MFENLNIFIKKTNCEKGKQDLELPELPDFSKMEGEILPVPALVQQAEDITLEKSRLKSPGMLEHADNDVKRVLTPDIIEGCRIDIQKSLGSKFAVSHSIMLGSQMAPEGLYQFGANVAMGNISESREPDTLLISRISHDRRLIARWHQRFSNRFAMRVQAQASAEPGPLMADVDLDFSGDTCTANMKLSSTPLIGLAYFQSITNSLAIGGVGYYHCQHEKSVLSYAARYTTPDYMSMLTYGSVGTVQLHYLRKLSERVNLASELAYHAGTGESTANVGAEYTLRQSRFLTNVDHTGRISSTLDCKVSPALTLQLSASAHHKTDDFKFGYGFSIGQ